MWAQGCLSVRVQLDWPQTGLAQAGFVGRGHFILGSGSLEGSSLWPGTATQTESSGVWGLGSGSPPPPPPPPPGRGGGAPPAGARARGGAGGGGGGGGSPPPRLPHHQVTLQRAPHARAWDLGRNGW